MGELYRMEGVVKVGGVLHCPTLAITKKVVWTYMRPFVSTPMLTPRKGTIAVLALVLLFSGSRLLDAVGAGGVGGGGHVGLRHARACRGMAAGAPVRTKV